MDDSFLPPFSSGYCFNTVAGKSRSKLFFLTRKFMLGIPSDVMKVFVQQLWPALLILGVREDMSPADRSRFCHWVLLTSGNVWEGVPTILRSSLETSRKLEVSLVLPSGRGSSFGDKEHVWEVGHSFGMQGIVYTWAKPPCFFLMVNLSVFWLKGQTRYRRLLMTASNSG